MNETAIWFDMVGNMTVDTTGTKYVPFRSTGNEKVKRLDERRTSFEIFETGLRNVFL